MPSHHPCYLASGDSYKSLSYNLLVARNTISKIVRETLEANRDIFYALVGDDAFALKSWMMKPYPHRHLTREQRIFKYRLSRARKVIENAFDILSSRFRCLLTNMEQEPKNVETIVYAACVLHNLIRIRGAASATAMEEGDLVDNHTGNITPGAWRTGVHAAPMVSLQRLPGNTERKSYYNSKLGSVPWQNKVI